ncbi:DUF3925 family protein [Microbacteriaceae bacterium 4G12]
MTNQAAQREGMSNREFYFVLYMVALLVLGWIMDVNAIFLSKWFNLAGMIMVPTIGGLIGFFVMNLGKKAQN